MEEASAEVAEEEALEGDEEEEGEGGRSVDSGVIVVIYSLYTYVK